MSAGGSGSLVIQAAETTTVTTFTLVPDLNWTPSESHLEQVCCKARTTRARTSRRRFSSVSMPPAIAQAFERRTANQDNSGAVIRAVNEAHKQVSVGYALPQQSMVNWAILVEQARSEVWQPINHLRDILLACIFATAAFMAIIAFPIAHAFSLPITPPALIQLPYD